LTKNVKYSGKTNSAGLKKYYCDDFYPIEPILLFFKSLQKYSLTESGNLLRSSSKT
jgi:hypothetical protein